MNETKTKILKELTRIIEDNEFLRIGQLISCVIRNGERQFHIPDEELLTLLVNCTAIKGKT